MVLGNDRGIGINEDPYIVAELNSSHEGKIDKAKLMIDAAKECGCDCVKFQSWTAESLYSDEYYAQNPISKRFVAKVSLDEEKLRELFSYCRDIGIDYSSTPYSEREVDFLVKEDAPFIKIASMEINNLPFLEYIAKTGKPIVLSTGMSTYDEIEQAVNCIEKAGNRNLCILHCVSVYPADASIINLRNITVLKEKFPEYEVGYSDHTIGSEVACAAIGMGASLIEKHFTLDSKRMGMDNGMATEPPQMKELVDKCRSAYTSLGSTERIISADEHEQRLKMRRSIVSRVEIAKGSKITGDMLEFKRPGTGIEPAKVNEVVGKQATQDIKKGYLLKTDDFE